MHRYEESYWSQYPGFYLTGDGGYRDEDGYVFVMGRTDDVMNVAGHRLSTGQIEEVVADHPAVAECAVIGIADQEKGQVPMGLLLLKDGVNIEACCFAGRAGSVGAQVRWSNCEFQNGDRCKAACTKNAVGQNSCGR